MRSCSRMVRRAWTSVGKSADHTRLPGRAARTGVIFAKLAQTEQRVALPLDVYPVYWRIASEAGVDTIGVETFPNFDLPAILDVCARSGTSYLMLPIPLKLHGRKWTEREVAQAVAWLGEDSGRRLILDGVYSLGLTIDALTSRLIETDQVIFLNSLSKGWLHELTMGVATVPDRDFSAYANSFQRLRLPQEQFFRARALLSRFRDFPNRARKRNRRAARCADEASSSDWRAYTADHSGIPRRHRGRRL